MVPYVTILFYRSRSIYFSLQIESKSERSCIVSSTYKRESTLKPMKANTWNVCIHYLSRDNPIELENMDQHILSQWYHSWKSSFLLAVLYSLFLNSYFFFFHIICKKNYNKKGLNGRCKFAINSPFEYKIPTLSSVKFLNKNNVLQTYYTKVIKLGLMTLMVTSLVTPKIVINCKILQTALHKCSIKFL